MFLFCGLNLLFVQFINHLESRKSPDRVIFFSVSNLIKAQLAIALPSNNQPNPQ
ncbi:hypothetical protein [Microcoleus sp. CZ3-B2]|uniref:hypothetical protein n=1 Tax=Microcoleus sp. CZ3-B2 TaxID=2818731 RepID=UPI0018805201